MELMDSRRLTGANILWDRPGAVIDVSVADEQRDALVAGWQRAARQRLDALGWEREGTAVRVFAGGASLAISAPLDALYAATEVNESAWRAAVAGVLGAEPTEAQDEASVEALGEAPEDLRGAVPEDLEGEVARLAEQIAAERNPALLALHAAARAHGVQCLGDDECVSVGLGSGSRSWPVGELPPVDAVDWDAVHDVPTAMVTGTNGKTTTVRLLAAIAAAAGRCAGVSSTDRIQIGSQILEQGDWSGPGGARRVLRDPRTEVGLLETARGGMLRRGLALQRCDVAAVLNVGADHLGEWGVGTLEGLAEGKFIVARVAATLVVNADDAIVARFAEALPQQPPRAPAQEAEALQQKAPRAPAQELVWFGLQPSQPVLVRHLAGGGRASVLDEGALWLCRGAERRRVMGVDEIPITMGGAARYNVANALAAAAIAERLGLPIDAIRAGLARFESDAHANPGRLNRFDLGGIQAIVDFAHNPHGLRALLELVGGLPARRRLVLLGQAGDRDDESIRELAAVTWDARPDMIVIKELTEHLRGRQPGEVPALIESELRASGAPPERFVHCASELQAVHWALAWARPGDLLLLLVHDHRDEVLSLLEGLTHQHAERTSRGLP